MTRFHVACFAVAQGAYAALSLLLVAVLLLRFGSIEDPWWIIVLAMACWLAVPVLGVLAEEVK